MSAVEFFDTNIFIYLFDDTDPDKQATAERLITLAISENKGCISFQVVQETLHILTRKFARTVPPEVAIEILQHSLLPLWQVQPSVALYTRAINLQDRYQYSFYDSLIIAAALEAGCTRLYSEDMQHGQTIEGLTLFNPFLG
jgi:predicted nucleic acid-binding protein